MKTVSQLRNPLVFPCLILSVFFCIPLVSPGQAPTHTAKFSPQLDDNINGYWEYLPRDYNVETGKKYPLLVFIHGAGEQGSVQDMPTMERVLVHGVPRLISNGGFPESFVVNGTSHRFIVISPQIKNGYDPNTRSATISSSTIDTVIKFAIKTYRVDESRIYLTGLSMGGGATWKYAGSSLANAQKLAAIALTCGAADLTDAEAGNIAAANLPVLATHNSVDSLITSNRTESNVSKIISQSPAGNVLPRMIIWNSPGQNGPHDSWNRTFRQIAAGSATGGNVTDTLGINTYQWLLQFSRTSAIVPVRWLGFSAVKRGNAVLLNWKISDEISVAGYEVERSNDAINWMKLESVRPSESAANVKSYSFTDKGPNKGINYYRIKQNDLDGRFSYSIVVNVRIEGSSSIAVFPTKFTSRLEIHSAQPLNAGTSIAIVDLNGRTHRSFVLRAATNYFAIDNLNTINAGAYLMQVRATNGKLIAVKKLIK